MIFVTSNMRSWLPSWFGQDATESNFRYYVRVTNLVLRFPESLQFDEKLNRQATSEYSNTIRSVLGITPPDNETLSKAEMNTLVL